MSVPRFHASEAAPGARVALPDPAAHHAREVLRLRPGAAVRLFDGRGAEYEGRLDVVTKSVVSVHLGSAVEPRAESPLLVTLAIAPLKGDRMELVVQKATELGVAEVWPVITARTDAAARPALAGSRQVRWEKVASSAAEQCGRAVVPRIAPTRTLGAMLEDPFDGERLLFLETRGQSPLPRSIAARAVLLLVGPAGGWEPHEVERLAAGGFRATALGPRILRTETAAIAALTAVQVLWGDLS